MEEEEEEEESPNSPYQTNAVGIYFGVSCALLALQFSSRAQARHEKAMNEVVELKRARAEDAKANERVMSIVAARERGWQAERRRLSNRIHSLSRESALREKKVAELEERLGDAEKAAEDVAELEGEVARFAARAGEERRELARVSGQKEEAAAMLERLSEEFVEVARDGEQKGRIVSAMVRKARRDAAEKQALWREVRTARAREKRAEIEAERWKRALEGGSSRGGVSGVRSGGGVGLRSRLLEYLGQESVREHEFLMEGEEGVGNGVEFEVQCLSESDDNLGKLDFFSCFLVFFVGLIERSLVGYK